METLERVFEEQDCGNSDPLLYNVRPTVTIRQITQKPQSADGSLINLRPRKRPRLLREVTDGV